MQTTKIICNRVLLTIFGMLLITSYGQLSYANSKEYLSKWYEYKLQMAKGTIDNSTIDEIANDLANNKKPIYSLIVDSNNLPSDAKVLEKLLDALKTNTTIKDLSFLNFSGENIQKIAKILNDDVLNYRKSKKSDWIISVDFTNNGDNINAIEETTAKEISRLIENGLISLNLSGNKISTDDLTIIVRELPGSKLTHLHLNKIKIGRGGIDVLANALRRKNNRLYFLGLDQNNIDSDSAVQIIYAISWSTSKNISLAGNNIGNDKQLWLTMGSNLDEDKQLYNINLAKNNIDSADIIELSNAIRNHHESYSNYNPIFIFNLAENKIDSKGALAIAESYIWKHPGTIINLSGNNIGLEGAMALIKTADTKEKLDGLGLKITDIENSSTVTNKRSEL